MGKFREYLNNLNEVAFKADKVNSTMSANGDKNAYDIEVYSDKFIIKYAKGWGSKYDIIATIDYGTLEDGLKKLKEKLKLLKKTEEYSDLPLFGGSQDKQVELMKHRLNKLHYNSTDLNSNRQK